MDGFLKIVPDFTLRSVEAPWGDYGHMLYHGMSMHLPRAYGRIQLERTGPEIFPITFPGAGDVVVTDEFRRCFQASHLTGVTFLPVIKSRIVECDWSAWDASSDEPAEYPESGEPEDYILQRPHSHKAAASMPELFELVPSQDVNTAIHYIPQTRAIAVSATARDWFERFFGDYVSIAVRQSHEF